MCSSTMWRILVNNSEAAALITQLFFFSSRRRHTRLQGDWSSDVCSSDLSEGAVTAGVYLPNLPPTMRAVVSNDTSNGAQAPVRYHPSEHLARSLGYIVGEIGRASCRKECRSRWSPYH